MKTLYSTTISGIILATVYMAAFEVTTLALFIFS